MALQLSTLLTQKQVFLRLLVVNYGDSRPITNSSLANKLVNTLGKNFAITTR